MHDTLSRLPEGWTGSTVKIIITDSGDYTTFVWEFGKGVTFPVENAGWKPRPDALRCISDLEAEQRSVGGWIA